MAEILSKRPLDPAISRRDLLRKGMYGTIGLFAGLSLLGGLGMMWPAKLGGFGSKIVAGKLEDFPVGSIVRKSEGRFYISRLAEDRIMALWWKCPHLGCTVPWREDLGVFKCPCHGSVYQKTGQNIAGPAPRPLDYMEVEISPRGEVIVNTGKITRRAVHEQQHETVIG